MRHIGRTKGEFTVVQTFVSGEREYVRAWVGMEEAVEAFHHYTHNVSVKLGFTTEVVMTDGSDLTCMWWIKAEGLVFPTPEVLETMKSHPEIQTPHLRVLDLESEN